MPKAAVFGGTRGIYLGSVPWVSKERLFYLEFSSFTASPESQCLAILSIITGFQVPCIKYITPERPTYSA